MKLTVDNEQKLTVLETSVSDYIKKKCIVLDKITQERMERVFQAKLVYKAEPTKFDKSWMYFHINLDGETIGYFICVAGQYKGTVWISDVYIDEDYRQKGFGGLALNQLKEILKNKNYTKAVLSFVDGNPAERLYLKNGFTTKISTSMMCEL